MLLKIINGSSFLLALLIIIVNNSCKEKEAPINLPFNNETKEILNKYPTGEISRRFNIIKGRKEGLMIDYYPSGIKRAEKFFKNDKQHGKTTVWFENGNLKEVQYFDNDKQILGDTIYHENGKIRMIIPYKDNLMHGDFILYDDEGNVLDKATYDMGKDIKSKNYKPK